MVLNGKNDIHILYNKTIIVDLCFGGHGVLLKSKLNHVDLCSASVNMPLPIPYHSCL